MCVEQPMPYGTMITCLPGDVYEDGIGGCGKRFWVDER